MEISVTIEIRQEETYSSRRLVISERKQTVIVDADDYRRIGVATRGLADDTMDDVAMQLQALTRLAAVARDDER